MPLFQTPLPESADAWHRVTAPGGYEWWYFDAEDSVADLQVVAIFFQGFVFHPGYLRRYYAYLRSPTRVAPPMPAEYPCVYLAVYEKGKPAAQMMTQYRSEDFAASERVTDVAIGPNVVRRLEDGSIRVSVRGTPWQLTWQGPKREAGAEMSVDLIFKPRLPHRPHERMFLSRQMTGAEHRWVIADPLCDVEGSIRLPGRSAARSSNPAVRGTSSRWGGRSSGRAGSAGGRDAAAGRTLSLNGNGYHDHNYGAGPLGSGLRRWMWGRVLKENRVTIFHVATPNDKSLPDELHLLEADAAGIRESQVEALDAPAWAINSVGLAYPREMSFKLPESTSLWLRVTRQIDVSPFYMRMQYAAVTERMALPRLTTFGTAFCEIGYPNRLRWPILGRMIEMSVEKV
jgi:carotenoid 1,2-hydratase